jgi:hypothetical protein
MPGAHRSTARALAPFLSTAHIIGDPDRRVVVTTTDLDVPLHDPLLKVPLDPRFDRKRTP